MEQECEKIEEKLYRIGMFSKMNQVTIKTLRYYDEVGLLRPASSILTMAIAITVQVNWSRCIVS